MILIGFRNHNWIKVMFEDDKKVRTELVMTKSGAKWIVLGAWPNDHPWTDYDLDRTMKQGLHMGTMISGQGWIDMLRVVQRHITDYCVGEYKEALAKWVRNVKVALKKNKKL